MKNFNEKNLLTREEMSTISGGKRSKLACAWISLRIRINDLVIKEADETYAQCREL
ncbi:hypothetical protein ACTS9M_15995 [Empedobacter sp. ULE_I136]